MPDAGCHKCKDHGSGYVPVLIHHGKIKIMPYPWGTDRTYAVMFPCTCKLGSWFNQMGMARPVSDYTIKKYADVWVMKECELYEFFNECCKLWNKKLKRKESIDISHSVLTEVPELREAREILNG